MTPASFRRVALTALALGVAGVLAAPSSGSGPFSFPHRPHLAAATVAAAGGGSDSDCRACHDYSRGDRDVHIAGCDKCHIDAAHLEKKVAGSYTRPAFQHKEHLFAKDGAPRKDVTCFSCHAPRVDGDWIEYSVPTAGLGPKSRPGAKPAEKTCADCHAAHEPSGGVVKQDERTGDGLACAKCHLKDASIEPVKYRPGARPATSARAFLHADHGGAAGDCMACHDAVKASKTIWDYDPAGATAGKCAGCHVDAAGKPLVSVAPKTTTITRIDFDRFPHAKHLGEFTRMKCATCHYPENDEHGRALFPKRVASDEPVGRAQLVDYAACDACHGHDGWAPEKPSWSVKDHGVGQWACFKCHDGGVDEKGKLAIAKCEVSRATVGDSKFAMHRHPGVAAGGAHLADPTQPVGGESKACSDCHIADAAELASRLAGRPFAHDPHLPANPTTENCLQCHTTSATSRRSEDLARFDAHLGRAPAPTGAAASARGCLDCHAGATAAELGLSDAIVARKAVQFDHGGHVHAASVVPGRKGMDCTECHQTGGKFGYTTPADVLDCSKCHAHEGDAAKVARTGPKTSQGDSAKCLFCHDKVRGDANGRVESPPRETITRSHLELGTGVQRHDKSGDCAACHVRDGAASAPYEERITKASVRTSIHDDPKFAGQWFNDPAIAKSGVDPQGRTCATCHRNEPRGYLRSLSGR